MKPKKIFIIRHGLSMGNIDGNVHDTVPDWKIELSTHGEVESRWAGEQLAQSLGMNKDVEIEPMTHLHPFPSNEKLGVYVSPYRRTRQTWAAMKPRFHPEKIAFEREDPRLREQEWGNLNAYRRADVIEVERENFGPFFYRFLNGESGADVYDRCTMFLETLYRDFQKPDYPSTVLIVTHGFSMRCLAMRWLHASVEEFHSWRNPKNCQMIILNQNNKGKFELQNPMEIYEAPKISQ